MFEKRVIIGKKYCVTAPSACLITANVNGVVVTLVDESTAGQYYFYAPTTSINSSVDPSYILEVAKSGGVGNSSNSKVTGTSGGYYIPSMSEDGVLNWEPSKPGMQKVPSSEFFTDTALQSRDNTFTGLNTFSGEVAGVLPWDFHAYSWCKTKKELYAACPDITERSVFCADLSSFEDISDVWMILLPPDLQKICVYYSGDVKGTYYLCERGRAYYIFAPHAKTWANVGLGGGTYRPEVVVIAPNCVVSDRLLAAGNTGRLFLICKNTTFNTSFIGDSAGGNKGACKEIIMPLNVVKEFDLPTFYALKNVPVGFPHATSINMNAAQLNKASVMAILAALQPYDASTMTTVPELTLGIDPTLDGDEEINTALLNAQTSVEDGGKGWNVAVNGFTITAGGGATMSLRKPVYAARQQNAEGCWVDAAGTRWSVRYGNTVLENWQANEQLGYEEFASLDDALAAWGLSEYVPKIIENT